MPAHKNAAVLGVFLTEAGQLVLLDLNLDPGIAPGPLLPPAGHLFVWPSGQATDNVVVLILG